MNLGDVLHELGDTPLKGHTWTEAIVTTLRAILPSRKVFTEDFTGRETLTAMVLIPETERKRLLASEVDLIEGTLTITSSNRPGPVNEAKSDAFHKEVLKDILADPSRHWGMVVGLVLVVIALTLTVVASSGYQKAGLHPHESLWQIIVAYAKRLFDALD